MNVEQWLGSDNQLGIDIWKKKYRHNNESFDEWLDRVSGGDKVLHKYISEGKFLFGGRTLSNRGTNKKASFSNCYSRGYVNDDLEDLMQASKDIAITFKAQGGQGLSLSKLRPKGCGINGGQFESDGIIPFMEIYNRTTESISQGGSRKGALIMTLDVWHKEAPDFIKIKSEEGKIQKANLSLEIDDEFMEDVKTYYDTGFVVSRTIKKEYEGNVVEYEVTPIELYKLIMEKAYDWAEPGCIYTNRFRNFNLMEFDEEYNIETCNPCGEQPLPKHAACNLGSINLSAFVQNPFTKDAYFDTEDFIECVRNSVEALDIVLDENMNNHALEEQRRMAENYRNIGLGIMGMHDLLIKLGHTYGSNESKEFLDSLMDLMFRTSVIKSSELAKEKGAFPKYSSKVLESKIIRNHFTEDELISLGIKDYGLRNCSLLSIAPSGSIGTMLNISTGCEPLFQISYKRKTESLQGKDAYYNVYTGVAKQYADIYGEELPSYFITSGDINWKDRVDIQAVLQNHVDTAISSTINLPNDIKLEEIEQLYLYAWKKGLKGVTIFRDGCKRVGILTTETNTNGEYTIKEPDTYKLKRGDIISVDDDLISYKRTLKTGCGKIYLHLDFDEVTGEPYETWIDLGSGGGCERNLEFISRLISLCLRAGVPLSEIISQSESIRPCLAYTNRTKKYGDTAKGTSCPSAIGIALKELESKIQDRCFDEIVDEEEDDSEHRTIITNKKTCINNPCPECGEELLFEGGCNVCKNCGYSKCE